MIAITTSNHEVMLAGANDLFRASLSTNQPEEGIDLVQLRIAAQQSASPPVFTLFWTHPIVDIHALWHLGANRNTSLPAAWTRGFASKATSQAPVVCLHSLNGRNRLTFAF